MSTVHGQLFANTAIQLEDGDSCPRVLHIWRRTAIIAIISTKTTFVSILVDQSDPHAIQLVRLHGTILRQVVEVKMTTSGHDMMSEKASTLELPKVGGLVVELEVAMFIHVPAIWDHLGVQIFQIEDLTFDGVA